MQPVILLIGVALVVWFWQQSLRARELAIHSAEELCRRQGLQLLDGTVALNALRLRRNTRGHIALQRTYLFDYSRDGDLRQQGFVLLLGLYLESAGLAAE
ncbi:MAG: DUF3301 domain-containing protein [Gammaproteobacteria bacterium]|nr:DUF3301 domain-containing protein [Gammaproteobacteria bacterium]